METIEVRRAKPEEYLSLWSLFHDTIHQVNALDYSLEQIAVWAPDEIEMLHWIARMEGINPLVAVAGRQVVGFTDLQSDGLVDMFFVHHQWQGQGIGKRLFAAIEEEADRLGLSELHSHVSITARPFFESRGFVVVKQQEVEIRGVSLTNFVMRKSLG
ncbi:GNAT family N-acetyltransferase [Blastopirellula marina]|uniref:GNAT family N-acetyltransferase n=1 Tax=Blastopirellula marina TaxID=124 RepID=A0A2S8GJ21_9BACT|nr:GNAT family N-acetyltransferase [Blastopirellula marina]PQO44439.1 GNAT family N-acetyltransferase [Blastopirellula marina]